MPKPTLLQSLLKQPTQSYLNTDAQQRRYNNYYHSVRYDMVRAAAAEKSSSSAISVSVSNSAHDDDDDDQDTFFTPTTSPRHSYLKFDKYPVAAPMGAPQQPTLLQSPLAMDKDTVIDTAKQNGIDIVKHATSENDDNDVTTSPLPDNVRRSSTNSSSEEDSESASVSSPEDSVATSASVSETSSPTSSGSSASASAPSTSTRVTATTPATSDAGSMRTVSSRSNNSLRRKKAENKRSMVMTYSNEDWAKDVRWLVPPTQTSASEKRKTWYPAISAATTPAVTTVVNKRRSARPRFDLDFASTSPLIPVLTNNDPLQIEMRAPAQAPPHHRRTASQSSIANSRRTIGRRRMSAVWEEDEGGVGDETAPPNSPRRVHTDPTSLASLNRARSLSSQQELHRLPERARSPTGSSMLSGMSGSIGSSAVSSAFTSVSRTVDLPNPLPVTDGGTPSGFTSLVLPRAAYTPSNNHGGKRYSLRFGNSSHVDITRSGLAQTTMSTVSITKNAASSVMLGCLRPRFLSLTSLSGSESRAKASVSKTPSHLLATLPRPLSITSHTPPPSKVNSHQVLVQVYAVALDGLDDRIVSERAARKDCYGFVPGRAIVGRAVEVGFEVNNVDKSDWVIGLLDVRKCGALAEFVIVEKRRTARCPRPSPSLTLEQLALLPLSGVPAHRAVLSVGVDAEMEQDSLHWRALVLQGHDGAGAFAVQALAYAGMHVTAHIPLHADPPRARTPSTSNTSESSSSSPEPALNEREETLPPNRSFPSGEVMSTSTREAEERVRRWGARGVRVGDALEVVENCDKGAFDVVIDTIGGKSIWAACQRILTSGGQFTTLVGDVSSSTSPLPSPPNSVHPTPSPSSSTLSPFPFHDNRNHKHKHQQQQQHRRIKSHSHSDTTGGKAVPSIHAHIRANFRSIRHAFKMRKSIGYALVSPAADVDQCGEDVRDSLVEVVRRATAGVFVPFVGVGDLGSVSEKAKETGIQAQIRTQDDVPRRNGRVVPFERAPELFGSGALSEGRTAIVRIVD